MAKREKALPAVDTVRLITPAGRLSFPYLLEARENQFTNKMEFSTTLIVKKSEVEDNPLWKKFRSTILQYGINELGAKCVFKDDDGRLHPGFKIPGLVDGDDTDREEEDGYWIIRARTPMTMPPQILGADGEELGEDHHHEVFPGANAALCLGLYYYAKKDQRPAGVSFNLLAVKLLGGGESLLGASSISREEAAGAFDSAGDDLPKLEAPAGKPAGDGDFEFDDDLDDVGF